MSHVSQVHDVYVYFEGINRREFEFVSNVKTLIMVVLLNKCMLPSGNSSMPSGLYHAGQLTVVFICCAHNVNTAEEMTEQCRVKPEQACVKRKPFSTCPEGKLCCDVENTKLELCSGTPILQRHNIVLSTQKQMISVCFAFSHGGCHVGMKMRLVSLVLFSTWQPPCKQSKATNDILLLYFLVICVK